MIIALTLQEAREAESAETDLDAVRRGVCAGLNDPSVAVYWLAEAPSGTVIASTSVVTEWSDFHGGHYWWIQSLFVIPEHRGRGIVDALLNHLAAEAWAAGALDLRLYVHKTNSRARKAYRRCGFQDAPYIIMHRSLRAD